MPSDQDEANHYSEISEEIYPLTPARSPSTAARSKRQLAEAASPLTSPPAAPSAAPAVIRSQTPEPAVRAAGTRGGGGRLPMDVEAVWLSGSPEGAQVSRVWLTEIGSTSKEFCVDVSLASGVTLTVPHMSDDNDGHWFSLAKDAATSQRLRALDAVLDPVYPDRCIPTSTREHTPSAVSSRVHFVALNRPRDALS